MKGTTITNPVPVKQNRRIEIDNGYGPILIEISVTRSKTNHST